MRREPEHVRKVIGFDADTWQAIKVLSQDTMRSLQELADEAFWDLLKKHGRPVTLREALESSATEMAKKTRKPVGRKRRR